jgi:hypothetical protein
MISRRSLVCGINPTEKGSDNRVLVNHSIIVLETSHVTSSEVETNPVGKTSMRISTMTSESENAVLGHVE